MQRLKNINFSYIAIPGFKPFQIESTVIKSGLKEGQNTVFVRNIRELHKLTRFWNENSKTRRYSIMPIQKQVLHLQDWQMLQRKRTNVRDRKDI